MILKKDYEKLLQLNSQTAPLNNMVCEFVTNYLATMKEYGFKKLTDDYRVFGVACHPDCVIAYVNENDCDEKGIVIPLEYLWDDNWLDKEKKKFEESSSEKAEEKSQQEAHERQQLRELLKKYPDMANVKNTPIEELGLSAHSCNFLKTAGINSIEDLKLMSQVQLLKLQEADLRDIVEITKTLSRRGIILPVYHA